MLLESLKANSSSGYIVVPRMIPHEGYITYNYAGMTREEISAWKETLTVPEVRRASPTTGEGYIRVLQGLGLRCALAGTGAALALRAEYNSIPLFRRLK
jgi:hypothetical protein